VVYESPANPEPAAPKELQHATLKPASAAMIRHVNKLYYKGIPGGETPHTRQVNQVYMVQPTRDQIEEFEITRTEIQRACAPDKVETHQNLFFSPSERQLQVMLDKNFQDAIESNAVGFCTNPEQALKEGLSKTEKLVMCRVIVAPSCRMTNNKLIVKDTRGVQPSFVLTLETIQQVNARNAADGL
jgi:hypothetical protein